MAKEIIQKHCKICDTAKPVSEFYSHVRDGRFPQCIPCTRAQQRERRKNPRDKEFRHNQYIKTRDATHLRFVSRRYGITPERYQQMTVKQKGRCAICGNVPKRRLDLDHCHKTGEVRELLCLNCNRGLGGFKDSPDLVRRALAYLLKHSQLMLAS